MLGLSFEHVDVIPVAGDLYCKTPEALNALLGHLQQVGYEVDNLREAKHRLDRGTTVEEMEKKGWSLWFASLRNIRYAKCGSCHQYISTVGTQVHGHTCEKCGAVVYLEHVDGSSLTFRFNPEIPEYERTMFSPRLRMNVHKWDTDEGYIYLYMDSIEGSGLFVSNETAVAYLLQHAHLYEVVDLPQANRKLMKVRYPHQWNRDIAAIEPTESYGHMWNHKIVKVWEGKEYGEWDRLPIPETLSVYETWHWAPLPASPSLHSKILRATGQTDDQGWHYQDGRPWFTEKMWQEMARFVRHFTQLDADAFDRAWPRFQRSGPGGIADLARFCHDQPIVTDKPNIGNTLVAYGKMLEGEPLTHGDRIAAERGREEDDMGFFSQLDQKLRNRFRRG